MYYKDFIAQAAIQIFAAQKYNLECGTGEEAKQAVEAAKTLAKVLEDDWRVVDHATVFFDPADQPTSQIENQLFDIKEAIEGIGK